MIDKKNNNKQKVTRNKQMVIGASVLQEWDNSVQHTSTKAKGQVNARTSDRLKGIGKQKGKFKG